MLKILKINTQYGKKVIFQHTEYVAYNNSLNMIIGPSGSGKSTLLKMIIDRVKYYDSYMIDDIDIDTLSQDEYDHFKFSYFGIVRQKPTLLKKLTIQDHINYLMALHHCQFDYQDYIEKLQLEKILDSYPASLSGGEKVRVGILLALIHQPAILILDEPTASLDQHHTKRVIELLKEYSLNHCVIIATHDKLLIEQADNLYQIKDKKLVHQKEKISTENKLEDHKIKPQIRKGIKYQLRMKKHHFVYNSMLGLLMAIVIALTAFSLQYANTAKQQNKNIIQELGSNEMVVYKGGHINHYEPISDEEIERILNLDHIKSHSIFYDTESSDYKAYHDCNIYDGNNELVTSHTFSDSMQAEDMLIKTSAYNEDSKYEFIKEYDNEGGAIITLEFLYRMGMDENDWQEDYEIDYIIQVPVYNLSQYMLAYDMDFSNPRFENDYRIITKEIRMKTKVKGIIETGMYNTNVNIYYPNDVVMNYIEENRPSESYEEKYMSSGYGGKDDYEVEVIYTPFQLTDLVLVIDDIINISEVEKQLNDMGYDVFTQFTNYSAILSGYEDFINNLSSFVIFLVIIVVIVTLIIKYINNRTLQKEKDFYRVIGFTKKEYSRQFLISILIDAIELIVITVIVTIMLCSIYNEVFAKKSLAFGYTEFNWIMLIIIIAMVMIFEMVIPAIMERVIRK